METTNIYDILHLLSLNQIRLNIDFGGGIWHLHIYTTIHFFNLFISKRVGKGPQAKTKVRGKKHTVASIQLFFFI
jgi:hypothetical protein